MPPSAYTPYTLLLPSPLAVVRLVKVAPPSVEILSPPKVAEYTVPLLAYTPDTVLLPSPLAVVRLVKVAPPSVEIPSPASVAA